MEPKLARRTPRPGIAPAAQESPGAGPVPPPGSAQGPQAEAGYGALKAAYLQHVTLKNFSPLSVRQNEQAIRLFVAWLEETGVPSVHQVVRDTLEQYKVHLAAYQTRRGVHLCLNTVRSRLFTIQNWFHFLWKKGVIPSNPIADVQAPKRVRRLPRGIMSVEEIRKVMEQPDLRSLLGYRDRTIMEVLYSTGMRAAELCDLEAQDLDLEKKTARIRHGKGNKERYVLLTTPCVRFLTRYLAEIRPELAQGIRPAGNNWLKKYRTGGDLLFLSLYGGPLGRTWLGQVMKQYIRAAGITKPVSPVHSWRHSVATHLMEAGLDVRYVQVMLSHASINSTQIYTHVERKTLQKHLKRFHPRENTDAGFQPFVPDEEKKNERT